jgi:hypothetical protein
VKSHIFNIGGTVKGINRFKLMSIILIAAYLLSACSGLSVQSPRDAVSSGKGLAQEVAFTGTVESLGPSEITVNGQTVSMDAKTMVDPNIKVGDTVKVEAQVSDTGAVLALKVESFGAGDIIPTVSSDETSTPEASETPEVTGTPDPSVAQTESGSEKEIIGVINDISSDSITIDGVVYHFAPFTEVQGIIAVGDTVKLHVIVNADGSFTVREAEKVAGTGIGADNSVNNDDQHEDDSSGSNSSGNGSGG